MKPQSRQADPHDTIKIAVNALRGGTRGQAWRTLGDLDRIERPLATADQFDDEALLVLVTDGEGVVVAADGAATGINKTPVVHRERLRRQLQRPIAINGALDHGVIEEADQFGTKFGVPLTEGRGWVGQLLIGDNLIGQRRIEHLRRALHHQHVAVDSKVRLVLGVNKPTLRYRLDTDQQTDNAIRAHQRRLYGGEDFGIWRRGVFRIPK